MLTFCKHFYFLHNLLCQTGIKSQKKTKKYRCPSGEGGSTAHLLEEPEICILGKQLINAKPPIITKKRIYILILNTSFLSM